MEKIVNDIHPKDIVISNLPTSLCADDIIAYRGRGGESVCHLVKINDDKFGFTPFNARNTHGSNFRFEGEGHNAMIKSIQKAMDAGRRVFLFESQDEFVDAVHTGKI